MTQDRVLPAHASPASRHRLGLARELIASCPPELGREIAITGSVARGLADSFSDVEINCWVDRLPAHGAWLPWLRSAGAEVDDSPGMPFMDDGWLWTGVRFCGIWIEIGWHEIAGFDSVIDRLIGGDELDQRRLQLGWIVQTSAPLRTEGTIRRWQNRLQQYPDSLQRSIIARNTQVWSDPHVAGVRWALASRNQRVGLALRLSWDVLNVLAIIYALNRRWPQDQKWTDAASLDLPVVPADFAHRLNHVFAEPDPAAAVRICFALILDTLALVPPEIDVSAARNNIEAARAGEPHVTRACAAVIREGTILMVECRHATHSHWTLPGGRVEDGETPEQAALRELAEETGLSGLSARRLYTRPWGRYHGEGLETCYLVTVDESAEPILGSDPELEASGQEIVALAWKPIAGPSDDPQVALIREHLR